ncbi:MAG: PTS sugar transporter subunit IIA [Candidatus Omnitrophota bacterium]
MKIADFFREDRILLSLNSSKKREAIKEISGVLQGSKEITDFDSFLRDVFEREELSTTGLRNYIAIPHARTDAVKEFVIAFGRSSQGVEFDSPDGNPSKFIFLMGTPREKGLNSYLKILAHLTRLLNKKEFQKELMEASSPKQVIEAFRKFEG